MTKTKNNLPLYAEEQVINEETVNIQKILNKFPQPIPTGFLKLESTKKNNWGSTEGLDKPLCERYLFARENKRIWLDIPHELMEKLELPTGKTCPWPLYLNPKVLAEGEEVEGAITIESEEELFMDKPVSEKNIEKELVKRMEELKDLRKKVEELDKEKGKLQEQNKKFMLLSLIRKKEINELKKIKPRSWLSFIEWLDENYIDKNKLEEATKLLNTNSQNFDEQKRFLSINIWQKDKFDNFSSEFKSNRTRTNALYWLISQNAKGFDKYISIGRYISWYFTPSPYEEGKNFKDLIADGEFFYKTNYQIPQDWEKLFLEWKLATPLRTINE